MRRAGRTLAGVAVLCVVASVAGPLSAQQSRQQRAQPGAQRAGQPNQSELLLDRFANRVAQALHLDVGQTRRLTEEMQSSRVERERLASRRQVIRRQLNRLVRAPSPEEGRIGELLDEFMDLQRHEAELNIEEQRRLADFMTPLQRARLFYLRQQLARQALERQSDRPQGRGVQERDPDGRI